MIAFPRLESRTVGVDGSYYSDVLLDTMGVMYSGSDGRSITVQAMVVNDDYNGGATTQDNCKYDYITNVIIPDETVMTFSSISLSAGTPDLTKGWRVIISIGGEDTVYALRQPAVP
jgi:hypothetical protein